MKKINHKTFLLLFLLFLYLQTSSSLGNEKLLPRKLMVSSNSLSVNKGKLSGSMVEPEKAVENGLRKRPPSSSNPTQN
ncbi:hypothetical protein CDL12_08370 [Handroanthus impetiginosus]|uniref:Non-specific serine/threonine protein kinase n=1 Tax=Handroanthus impetiginosus TaxID=429701 RepID=A0A2G9HN62_9LAMI|nr:hypothetical protein CDL12_08370 [Handroanthus impetiginosus]